MPSFVPWMGRIRNTTMSQSPGFRPVLEFLVFSFQALDSIYALVFYCYCNQYSQTSRLKTKQIYHFTVWEVRTVMCVSCLPIKVLAGPHPFWRMERGILFPCLSQLLEDSLVHALLFFKANNGLSLFSITSLWPPLLLPFSIFKDPCDPGFKVGWFAPFLPSATLILLCCVLYVTRSRIRKGPLFWLWRSSFIILCSSDFSSMTALTSQHWAPPADLPIWVASWIPAGASIFMALLLPHGYNQD